jgi:hypothetical protein
VHDRNGDGPVGAMGTPEAGPDVELGKVNVPVIADNPHQPQAEIQSARRAPHDAANAAITVLAELFPAAIVAEKRAPHKAIRAIVHEALDELLELDEQSTLFMALYEALNDMEGERRQAASNRKGAATARDAHAPHNDRGATS